MPFTPTANYNLLKPDINTEIDSWGDDLNDNWDKVSAQMKVNADGIVAVNTALAGKADTAHTHNAVDINAGTLAAARMPGHTGDATSPVGSVVLTITPGAVTNTKLAVGPINTVKGTLNGTSNADITFATIVADDLVTNLKLANMATQTIKGRNTAGTGDPEDLSVATVLTMLGISALIATEETVTTGGSLTVNSTHSGKLIQCTGTATITFTTDAAIPVGTIVNVGRYGTGEVTIGGTTLRSISDKKRISDQYGGVSVKKIASSEWWIWGDLKT